MNNNQKTTNFIVKDCSVSTIATGISAGSIIDLRDKLLAVPLESIYYHFWVGRLRPHFVHSGYHNDFAFWAKSALNEQALAEKLSILDPLRLGTLEDLRDAVVEVIDQALDNKVAVVWVRKEEMFHFVTSKIIVMNTLVQLTQPEELLTVIDHLSTSSIFYHFINSRRHTQASEDDFSLWLKGYGEKYQSLVDQFSKIDIHFLSLAEIKKRLSDIVHDYFRTDNGLS